MLESVRCDLLHKAMPDRDHRSIKTLNERVPSSINGDIQGGSLWYGKLILLTPWLSLL
jgi:hypothetical protein